MDVIKTIEESQKRDVAPFKVGDTVKGLVLCLKNSGVRRTFTVRKNSYGVGVERVFPLYSPRIAKVELVRPGKVRRSKLYYVRGKIGKGAKIRELIVKKSDSASSAVSSAAPAAAAPAQTAAQES